mgnify:CR=1 FL=1
MYRFSDNIFKSRWAEPISAFVVIVLALGVYSYAITQKENNGTSSNQTNIQTTNNQLIEDKNKTENPINQEDSTQMDAISEETQKTFEPSKLPSAPVAPVNNTTNTLPLYAPKLDSYEDMDKGYVAYYRIGCDYFIVEYGYSYALMEWFGGRDPSEGDKIVGNFNGFGFEDIYTEGKKTRVYIDDYLLSKSRATEKYFDKCD